ncbi:MAG: type IV toxin-antitoxin system AbiEi family antitoxin domain-containing protein [Gemmatimonadetes bacterium]|nr:type IV toxin-antitoxin system AbiEi family antitoxin domain-containing protein [Gemmatimonadota bacterium]
MNDTHARGPDHTCLFETASEQGGYFTSRQARDCGFSWAVLSHHVATARFVRVRRGLYRLKEYPSSPREEVICAWLAVGKDTAVVSHESALELLGLSDVLPDEVHVTLPRTRRGRSQVPGVRLHTTTIPPAGDEMMVVDGVRITSPARSIADAAAVGASPEHVLAAARQALARGMVTRGQLERAARRRGASVERIIRQVLDGAGRS